MSLIFQSFHETFYHDPFVDDDQPHDSFSHFKKVTALEDTPVNLGVVDRHARYYNSGAPLNNNKLTYTHPGMSQMEARRAIYGAVEEEKQRKVKATLADKLKDLDRPYTSAEVAQGLPQTLRQPVPPATLRNDRIRYHIDYTDNRRARGVVQKQIQIGQGKARSELTGFVPPYTEVPGPIVDAYVRNDGSHTTLDSAQKLNYNMRDSYRHGIPQERYHSEARYAESAVLYQPGIYPVIGAIPHLNDVNHRRAEVRGYGGYTYPH